MRVFGEVSSTETKTNQESTKLKVSEVPPPVRSYPMLPVLYNDFFCIKAKNLLVTLTFQIENLKALFGVSGICCWPAMGKHWYKMNGWTNEWMKREWIKSYMEIKAFESIFFDQKNWYAVEILINYVISVGVRLIPDQYNIRVYDTSKNGLHMQYFTALKVVSRRFDDFRLKWNEKRELEEITISFKYYWQGVGDFWILINVLP